MSNSGLSRLKSVSLQDQKMIEDIEVMLGPEPSEMGFIKNLFWGRVREDLVFPYPEESPEERAKCDALLAKLEAYLKNEHPAVQIDQEEYIPEWVFDRLFEMGVMGMTVPEEYGGLGLGVTSYNRVLELLGRYCSSTAVVVSAHQSIGCKAIMLFGTEEQKQHYLPKVAREYLSAFCLSEPNAGSDAAGPSRKAARPGSSLVVKTASTVQLSAPLRMSVRSARSPRTRFSAPIMTDLPAPVSPVMAL